MRKAVILEEKVEKVIAEKFNLPFPMTPEVKVGDDSVCMAEWEQIVPRNPDEQWGSDVIKAGYVVKAAPIGIAMLPSYEAYKLFMARFNALYDQDTSLGAAAPGISTAPMTMSASITCCWMASFEEARPWTRLL